MLFFCYSPTQARVERCPYSPVTRDRRVPHRGNREDASKSFYLDTVTALVLTLTINKHLKLSKHRHQHV